MVSTRQIGGGDSTNTQFLLDWMADHIDGWSIIPDDVRLLYQLEVHSDGSSELLCVVALNRWTPSSVEIHIATDGTRRWATRQYIFEVYNYIFNTSARTRLNAIVRKENVAAFTLHQRLGHTHECTLQHEFGENEAAELFGFTFEQFNCSKWNKNRDRSIKISK